MSQNTLLFVDWLVMEGLRILVNKLAVAKYMNTDYNKEYKQEFAVGSTVRVPLPFKFLIRDGAGYQPQALTEQFTTVTVDQMFGIDFEWDSVDQALKMPEGDGKAYVINKILNPCMAKLAQEIDSRASKWAYQNTNNITGILGTNATSMDTYQAARQRLVENACPQDGKVCMVVTPGMNRAIANALATVFNPVRTVDEIFAKGYLGTEAAGADWYESMSVKNHTAGTAGTAATVTVQGSNQSGSSLLVNGTAAETYKQGDVFNIASVFNVNPETLESTGTLKQFVVTQDITLVGGGNAADLVQISPAIVGPGSPYQNVDSLPVAAAAITLFPGTTSPQGKTGHNGLNMHRDAFALVGVKLVEPRAVEMASTQRDPETGVSISYVKAFDPIQRKMVNRFDVLMGFGNLYPDNLSVRVLGQ